MKIVRIQVRNFRGILEGTVHLDGHTVFVGENNAGKSTLLDAVDLVLGPERLSKRPVVDEHDFYAGHYVDLEKGHVVPIQIEVVVADLSDEQTRHFRDHVQWWDCHERNLLDGPPPGATDQAHVTVALRVFFNGWYDSEEDDFVGDTYFAHPKLPDGAHVRFTSSDKRKCGFLFLRTLRTGARALSLERGTLLDIILRLQETRLRMWEQLLTDLRQLSVGEKEDIGTLLASVQDAIRRYVPADWAEGPHIRVSDLTREMLRKTLTVFMGTGAVRPDGTIYAAPYQHQGTGTINALVLALLSIVAELKQNVIFAMEEPEIALPPHTQKRIISSVKQKSAQAIFTSHSPYVLEEFEPSQVLVLKRLGGVLTETPAAYPPSVKPKAYRAEFRARFCEALLAKYVLIVEGKTEFVALPAAARRLNELEPAKYRTLENLGVAVIDAQGQSNVAPLGAFFRTLGKKVFAAFDTQDPSELALIKASVDYPHESHAGGFEDLVVKDTSEAALRAYAASVVAANDWPMHLSTQTPTKDMPLEHVQDAMRAYFGWSKGSGDAGDLLASCATSEDMPTYVRGTLESISKVVEPPLARGLADPRSAMNGTGDAKEDATPGIPLTQGAKVGTDENPPTPAKSVASFAPSPPLPTDG